MAGVVGSPIVGSREGDGINSGADLRHRTATVDKWCDRWGQQVPKKIVL
jgi:hypothetical protein